MLSQENWSSHMRSMVAPVQTGDQLFRGGHFEDVTGRIFGGQVVAQALMAASHGEDAGRRVHSLHACFLRAGDVDQPVEYQVVELTAGRSFANRQITAVQGGKPILSMMASFHRPEEGPSHQVETGTVTPPDEARRQLEAWCARTDDRGRRLVKRLDGRPVEIVPVDPDALFSTDPRPPRSAWWLRLRHPLVGGDEIQAALLAYASDMMLLRNAMLPHGIRPFTPGVQTASLDHAIWFHAVPDLNDWLLCETDSPWSGQARGLSRGHFFTPDGRLVATVVQESLMRLAPPPPRPGQAG